MEKRYILLTPGPTPLPPEVLEAMSRQILHHRTDDFTKIYVETSEKLKTVFRTKNPVYMFASSGTGAMEASFVNFLSPNDPVLVVTAGKWGERFLQIAKAFGLQADTVEEPYGKAVDPVKVREALKNKPYKAVFATLCETSTGVVHDIKGIGQEVAKTDALFVVDGISGLLADRFEGDAWHVDLTISGSQKALMLPPGLAFLSVSEKAKKAMESAKLPRYYYDLRRYEKALAEGQSPFTPAVTLIVALHKALEKIEQEGMDNVFERIERLAKATREAVQALNMELFADKPSSGVTAVKFPAGLDGKKFVKLLKEDYRVVLAGGQGSMKGQIFRIAHMGYISEEDLMTGFEYMEEVLAKLSYPFTKGSSLKAFRQTVSA